MMRAIELAKRNRSAPFGAILVDSNSGEIVAEGVNNSKEAPWLHGEVAALQNANEHSPQWENLSIYTTAEPCCMCQAAIIWCGVPQVVYGTSIPKLTELGWNQFDLRAEEVAMRGAFNRCAIRGGILADECDQLFSEAAAMKNLDGNNE